MRIVTGAGMKILWLAPALPWPLHSGEKLRSYHLARQLARDCRITMLAPGGNYAAARALADAGIAVLRAGRRLPAPMAIAAGMHRGLPATVARYSGNALRQAVRVLRQREQFDLIYLDHLQMTGMMEECAGVPLWLDEHNLECRLWQRYADERGGLWRRQARQVRAWEQQLLPRVAGVSFTSENDQLQALALAPAGRYAVVPNAADVAFWQATPRTPQRELLLTGSLDWPPNRDGIIWFIDEVWPQLRGLAVGARVVGSRPPDRFVERCAAAGIAVDADVPSLQPYYARALAVVAPLLVGGGMRFKVVEAFAVGVPLVATTLTV
ncbi:MAG TPA: glycosyltransferase, partial [bacterium]|nr:glycosyltransferase [bacterium]